MNCEKCGAPIPEERLAALPGCTTCVKHSDAKPRTEADVELDGPDPLDLTKSAYTPERGK